MEVIKGIQTKWEKWKSGSGEREMRREIKKRYTLSFWDMLGGDYFRLNSPNLYKNLTDEDQKFVNELADKFIGWGPEPFNSEAHFREFMSTIHKRSSKPSKEAWGRTKDEIMHTPMGRGVIEIPLIEELYDSHLFWSTLYRVWLKKRRSEKGLPPPTD